MKLLTSWLVTLRIIARYFLYRVGIGSRPNFTDRWDEVQLVYRQVTGMDARLRLRGLEHFPGSHPAVYAGNHIKLDDPFFVCYAVQEASKYTQRIRFVMRDDFFLGFPWTWMPFRMNEVAEMGGAYLLSKGGVTLAQLKPLIDMLLEPDSFVIFPNGSRSRSGLCFEYREDMEGPGSMAFFLAQAQRKNPDVPVPAVPVGRTFNPVTGVSTVIMGKAAYLAPDARREGQREFDDELVVAISDLVEINLCHLLGGVLFLHCLHGQATEFDRDTLEQAVRAVITGLGPHRYLDPAVHDGFLPAFTATLRYFEVHGMIALRDAKVTVISDRVLAVPALDTRYRKNNPIRYAINQILHLPDLIDALEGVVLAR